MRYEICTEYKNVDGVRTILNQYVDAYTIIEGLGAWKGTNERSMTIVMVGVRESVVETIAKDIKRLNQQEAVLIIRIPCQHNLV